MIDQHTFGMFSVSISDHPTGHRSMDESLAGHLSVPESHLISNSPGIPLLRVPVMAPVRLLELKTDYFFDLI